MLYAEGGRGFHREDVVTKSRSRSRLLHDSSGQTMLEYIIVVILVALTVMFSIGRFQSALGRKYDCGSAQASEFDVEDKKFSQFADRGGQKTECTGFQQNVSATSPVD
jgi:Flp pilus assembly pilin Flp